MMWDIKVVERFWRLVAKSEDGCWIWLGRKNNSGYGVIPINGRSQYAHRLSYAIHFGSIPKGMSICHHCDNPACVRPDHLFCGTHRDNMRDMASKNRHGRRGQHRHSCEKGHPLTKGNTYWTTTDGQAVRTCKLCHPDYMATIAYPATGRWKPATCKRGHPMTGDNLRSRQRGDGSFSYLCRACDNLRSREYRLRRQRQKAAQAKDSRKAASIA